MSSSTDSLFTRLHRVARGGNISAISELLGEDPLLLQRIGAGSPTETPLHIASLVGHVEFAAALLEKQADLARMRDEQGFYPLHLASAKGHVQVAKMMIQDRADLCKLRDKEGRTPLHSAAANGQIDVLKELLSQVEEATAQARTERGEITLHLCVQYNQVEAAEFLVDKDKSLVNMKDDDGNTVLHLATARKQIQLLELFLGVDGVDAEAKNKNGFTALDVLVHSPSERGDIKILEILEKAGCKRATRVANRSDSYTDSERNEEQQAKQIQKNILIAATVIATVTFTAGYSPPGSVWTDVSEAPKPSAPNDHKPGTAIFANKMEFNMFLAYDMVGFLASCTTIFLILIGRAFKNRRIASFVAFSMGAAITSLVLAFFYGAALVSFPSKWHASNPAGPLYVVVILCLGYAFFHFRIHKYFISCKSRRRDNRLLGTATDIEGGQNIV